MMLPIVSLPPLGAVLRLYCLQTSQQTKVLSADLVYLSLPLDVVETLLGSPISVPMVHPASGVHNLVHFTEQLVIVTLDSGLPILFNLRVRKFMTNYR